jgi:hypothetical protein
MVFAMPSSAETLAQWEATLDKTAKYKYETISLIYEYIHYVACLQFPEMKVSS